MNAQTLLTEISTLPKALREEVSEYVALLKKKAKANAKLKSREFGFAKGKIKLAPDFDEPLEEFKNYM